MIAVDSSVWIANLRGNDNLAVFKLRVLTDKADNQLLIGDLILLEVLRGARDEAHASQIERNLRGTRSRRCWTKNSRCRPPRMFGACMRVE